MRHWWWCRVTRGDEEDDTNGERVESILTAHDLQVNLKRSKPNRGLYLILLPEFPESVEIAMLEMGVGELTVTTE